MIHIVVVPHAGWPERLAGILIPGLHQVPSSTGVPQSVVSLENGEIHAVPSSAVFTPHGLRYAEEWAVKTHCLVSDVVVPRDLRVPS